MFGVNIQGLDSYGITYTGVFTYTMYITIISTGSSGICRTISLVRAGQNFINYNANASVTINTTISSTASVTLTISPNQTVGIYNLNLVRI